MFAFFEKEFFSNLTFRPDLQNFAFKNVIEMFILERYTIMLNIYYLKRCNSE